MYFLNSIDAKKDIEAKTNINPETGIDANKMHISQKYNVLRQMQYCTMSLDKCSNILVYFGNSPKLPKSFQRKGSYLVII